MNAKLSEDLDRLVRSQIESGGYTNEADVFCEIRDWLRDRVAQAARDEVGEVSGDRPQRPASLGIFSDIADEIAEMTEEIMKDREARWSRRSSDEQGPVTPATDSARRMRR